MDEYTDEEIIIIDDFRAGDSIQFNELILDPYHSAPCQLDNKQKIYSVSFSSIT